MRYDLLARPRCFQTLPPSQGLGKVDPGSSWQIVGAGLRLQIVFREDNTVSFNDNGFPFPLPPIPLPPLFLPPSPPKNKIDFIQNDETFPYSQLAFKAEHVPGLSTRILTCLTKQNGNTNSKKPCTVPCVKVAFFSPKLFRKCIQWETPRWGEIEDLLGDKSNHFLNLC